MKPTNNLLFIASTVKSLATGLVEKLVQLLLPFLELLLSPINIMKVFQFNKISLQTSHNQLKFYQEQNNYDIIALQETNVKGKLEIFKN